MTISRTVKLVALWVLAVVAAPSCKEGAQPPDPSAFGTVSERAEDNPRNIVFHNESVEMAALEIFAPAKTPQDCQSEAPHRLLCPGDYRHIYNQKVYPRTKASINYPEELALECAQVWVRVHSKVMKADEHREAIFLLTKKGKGLQLELGEGVAARLEARELQVKNKFPAPIRFCPLEGDEAKKAPTGTRLNKEVADALGAAKEALQACCKSAPCRGMLQVTLTVKRDGSVGHREVSMPRGQVPQDCLTKALEQLRFSGFTEKPTTAEITLRLPHGI
jgi:hypothetical protein